MRLRQFGLVKHTRRDENSKPVGTPKKTRGKVVEEHIRKLNVTYDTMLSEGYILYQILITSGCRDLVRIRDSE